MRRCLRRPPQRAPAVRCAAGGTRPAFAAPRSAPYRAGVPRCGSAGAARRARQSATSLRQGRFPGPPGQRLSCGRMQPAWMVAEAVCAATRQRGTSNDWDIRVCQLGLLGLSARAPQGRQAPPASTQRCACQPQGAAAAAAQHSRPGAPCIAVACTTPRLLKRARSVFRSFRDSLVRGCAAAARAAQRSARGAAATQQRCSWQAKRCQRGSDGARVLCLSHRRCASATAHAMAVRQHRSTATAQEHSSRRRARRRQHKRTTGDAPTQSDARRVAQRVRLAAGATADESSKARLHHQRDGCAGQRARCNSRAHHGLLASAAHSPAAALRAIHPHQDGHHCHDGWHAPLR